MNTMLLKVLGVVLMVVGLLGFVNNPILGIFAVDPIHNVIHLLTGAVAFFYGAKNDANAMMFGKVFGIVYLLVTILGFMLPGGNGQILGLVTINPADNWLHVLLTAAFLYVGFMPMAKAKA